MADKDVLLNKVLIKIKEDIVNGDPSHVMKLLNEHVPHKYLFAYINRNEELKAWTQHVKGKELPTTGLEDAYKLMTTAINSHKEPGRKDEE